MMIDKKPKQKQITNPDLIIIRRRKLKQLYDKEKNDWEYETISRNKSKPIRWSNEQVRQVNEGLDKYRQDNYGK